MIIVTGGAGFIGSNLIRQLNLSGESEILVVDNLAPTSALSAPKFLNLAGSRNADFMDKREFRAALKARDFENARVRAIFHQGACSNTLEDDGQYMMDNNFTYSKELFHFAVDRSIPFVYASTAAVYGSSLDFREDPANERPLNVYGYSKLSFDNYVRCSLQEAKSTVVGLRYFNVYGAREQHKGRMASVIHQFGLQLKETGTIRMFGASGGYGDGEQRRDFVFVNDVARINMFFAGLLPESPTHIVHGVFNVGTGKARAFNEVAQALMETRGPARVEYVPFPSDLISRYQSYTEADISSLRSAGYDAPLTGLEEGVRLTFDEE